MRKRVVFICLLMLIAFSALFAEGKKDEKFPSKPIRIILPWAPGGLAPTLAEMLKPILTDILGVPVVTENKPGGGTAVGMKDLQISPPDGYTIGMNAAGIFGATHTTKGDVDYRNFELICSVTEDYYAITVHKDSPWNTLPEFLAYMKANPGQVRIGHSGVGSAYHVALIVFAQDMNVDITAVPFGGGGPALTALMGNHIEATIVPFGDMTSTLPTGQLRVLAVGAPVRDPFFPDIPTVKEVTGIDSVSGSFRCFFTPKETPLDRIKIIEDAIKKATEHPTYVEFCNKNGITNMFEGRDQYMSKYNAYADVMLRVLRTVDAQ